MKRISILVCGFVLVMIYAHDIFAQHPERDFFYKSEASRWQKSRLQPAATTARAEMFQNYDVHDYKLALKIDPLLATISGEVTLQASLLTDDLQAGVDLYDNMLVDSVLVGGDRVSFVHANNQITLTLPPATKPGDSFALSIFYHGQPQIAGGFASFEFTEHAGVPVISTLSEPFGAPTWWPCKDDPADKADSVDVIVTVPGNLYAVSNGLLQNVVQNADGTKTFHWAERYPISTYLVSLAVTNYAIFSDFYRYSGQDSMEVIYYVYPEHLAAAQEDFKVTVPMIEAFAGLFGEYPFLQEKYGMAEFPWGGAMEHQTCTSYGTGLIRGDHKYDWVVAHELSHQWFGDLVTLKRWPHIWLNEGFASYCEALWTEHKGGNLAYHDYMDGFDNGLFPTSVYVTDSTNISALFGYTVYDKGAWVLHMLRHVMGDSTFFDALRTYAQTFAYANATTEDFQHVCEDFYGKPLDWFFQEWVYEKFRPSYSYAWSTVNDGNASTVSLTIQQVQTNTGLFKMPLDVKITTAGGDSTIVVWDSLATQQFDFVFTEPVKDLTLDPEHWLLRELNALPTHVALQSPERFVLYANYPNPFNAGTQIRYELAAAAEVKLTIVNLLGQRVRTLVHQRQVAGNYTVRWDGRDDAGREIPSGVYVYALSLNGEKLPARKMVFLK